MRRSIARARHDQPARRRVGVSARRRSPRRRPTRSARRGEAGAASRCRGSGRCRASASRSTRTSQMPFAEPAAERARAERDRHLPPPLHRAARLEAPAASSCISAAFEGVLYVLVNGSRSGSAKDSKTPAEFDITELVRHDAPNELHAVVVRWSDASFIEDQDQWWHAGLSRSIYLCSPTVRDLDVRASLDDDYRHGRLSVEAGRRRRGRRLLDPRGRARLRGASSPTAGSSGRFARRSAGRPRSPPCTRSSYARAARRSPCRRRLPPRRDPRPAAARQRQAAADPRRQPPRARRRPRPRAHARERWRRTRG